MAEEKKSVYREKTLERISTPDQLTDYLKVTNPGIWVILAAVIILLAGIFAWSCTGVMETKADAKVIVKNNVAQVAINDAKQLSEGDELRMAGESYKIASTAEDKFGRVIGIAQVDLPDGIYDGIVVVDKTHPIKFLTESNS